MRVLSFIVGVAALPGCGGSTSGNDAGADDGGTDHGVADLGHDMSDPCDVDQRVEDNACVACGAGSTNAAGDDANGADTTCDPTLCNVNQRVENHACVACAEHHLNPAGDDASGADTACTPDPCYAALGVMCDVFDDAYIKA